MGSVNGLKKLSERQANTEWSILIMRRISNYSLW